MKYKHLLIFVTCIVGLDQALKCWVKTHMYLKQQFVLIPNWFRLYFIENQGMAYGLSFGGEAGKIGLTLFRLLAVVIGLIYLRKLIDKKYSIGLTICCACILAGAIGNLIDSLFYGILFSESTTQTIATFMPPTNELYGRFLQGKVVDMLYFPLYEGYLPSWLPFVGNQYFIFFGPIFNLADSAISIGAIAILVFQRSFFRKRTSLKL